MGIFQGGRPWPSLRNGIFVQKLQFVNIFYHFFYYFVSVQSIIITIFNINTTPDAFFPLTVTILTGASFTTFHLQGFLLKILENLNTS